MAVGTVIPDTLADLQGLKFTDQPWADKKTDHQGRNRSVDGPKRNIAEDIKRRKCCMKRV
jgi:outer membrane PBP1 activator LpoA protein